MRYSAFVSYSNKDKLFVDALVHRLEIEQVPCWYAPRDIPPGMAWPAAIAQAMANVSIMILVLSEASNYSQEVSKELTLASNSGRMVIPVRIADVQPNDEFKYHLSNRHWLDVYDLEMEAAISKVLDTLLQHRDFYLAADGTASAPAASAAGNARPRKAESALLLSSVDSTTGAAAGPTAGPKAPPKRDSRRQSPVPRRISPLWLGLDSVFLALFNALFFMFQGTHNPPSVWISYGFIHFAYAVVLLSPFWAGGGSRLVLSLPVHAVSSVYFLVQLLLGILLIWIAPVNYLYPLAAQLVLLAFFAWAALPLVIANRDTSGKVQAAERERDFLKGLKADLETGMARVEDAQHRKALENVHDMVKSSPAKSHPSLGALEDDIAHSVRRLVSLPGVNAAEWESAAKTARNFLTERNQRLRALWK